MRRTTRRLIPRWIGLAMLGFAVLTFESAIQNHSASAADVDSLLATIQSVDRGGQGNGAAMDAWRELSKSDPDTLPTILAALDDANPLAANWLRSSVETIGDRAKASGNPLPLRALEEFLADTSHAPKARRLAYDWILQADPTASDRLVAGFLNDPSRELRRDAVSEVLEAADTIFDGDAQQDALPVYRRAFDAARDPDQVKLAAKRLIELGETVDVLRHYGYIDQWHVIGPFDNTDEKGFAREFPPEETVDLTAEYQGKKGTVQWVEASTDDEGKVDLHDAIEKLLGVTAYATVEFISDKAQQVDLRFVSLNAVKLWVNGELVASHEVYHTGDAFDQYGVQVNLKDGKNRILLKVCQNEMEPEWAHKWEFKLRVCDPAGTAILSAGRQVAAKSIEKNTQ